MENASANRTHAAGALFPNLGADPQLPFLDRPHRTGSARWLDRSSATPTNSRPPTTTSASAGKWDASRRHWPRDTASADQFGAPTGPTAWEPPLYPYLIAGVFHIFGIYSKASAFVLLTINSVFSALTCVPIFLIAKRMFSEKVAVGSAWAWALLPNVMFWCTRAVWETSLSALLLATVFWLTLTLEDRDGWLPWVEFGAALGPHRAERHFPALVSSRRGTLGLVSSRKTRQTILRRRGAGVRRFLRLHHAVAGPQLSNVRKVHLHSRQLRR